MKMYIKGIFNKETTFLFGDCASIRLRQIASVALHPRLFSYCIVSQKSSVVMPSAHCPAIFSDEYVDYRAHSFDFFLTDDDRLSHKMRQIKFFFHKHFF